MDFNMIGLNASAYSKGAQRIQPGNSPSLPKAELNDPAETFHSTRSESTTPVVTKPLGLNSSPNAVDFGGALTIELPPPPPNADASAAKEKSAASTASVPTYFTIEQPQVTPESSELKFDFKALSDSPILHYKATWSNPLQSINPMKMSPLGDLLNLSGPNVSQVLMERADAISIEAQQRKAFTQGLKETLTEMVVGADGKAVEKPRKDALPRLQNLVKFLVHGEKPADWAPPQDLSKATALDKLYSQPTPPELKPNEKTSLIESLKDNGAFGDVVKLYEDLRGKDPSFTAYEIPREYYVVALNKLGASRIKDSITESEAMIADRISAQNMKPVSFLEANQRNLYRTMGVNGDVLAGLGKAFKNIHSLAEKQIDSIASNANVAQLVSDLSGVPLEQFKVGNGDRTAKEVGTDKATGKFNERINTLAGRSFSVGTKEYEQNQKDMTDFLESSLGQKLDQIGLSLVSLSTQLQLGKTPVEAVEVLTNRPHQEWALTKKEIVSAASDPFSAVTGRIARGKSFDELSQLATKATGLSTSNVVGQAALRSKMEQVQSAVTQQGSVDPELVSLVSSKTASGSNGKNLLQLSRQALEVSRDYYQAGFGVDFEYYPGINVVYNELALGNTKVAENLIPLVQYSVAREGGAKSTDYWNLATQVELAAIGGQARTAHDVFPRVMRSAKAGWELGTTADNLEKLARQFKEEGKDASVMEFVASKFRQRMEIGFPAPDSFNLENFISDAQKEISAGRDFGSAPIGNARDLARLEQVTEKIMGKSKSFSDAFTSKFVGGSWAFVSKGGVADTVINRPTVAALRQVNSALGFDNLESPDDFATFRDTMHQYIDAKFGLVEGNDRPMEDLLSKIHKDRDKFTENRHELCHSRTSGNGRAPIC